MSSRFCESIRWLDSHYFVAEQGLEIGVEVKVDSGEKEWICLLLAGVIKEASVLERKEMMAKK